MPSSASETSWISPLSLHDALPICSSPGFIRTFPCSIPARAVPPPPSPSAASADRKSTRLNSSHLGISYAVFCFGDLLDLPSFPTRRSSDLFVTRLYKNVPVLDSGARGSTTTFAQRGIG